MTDAQKYAKVFRAASAGIHRKLDQMRMEGHYQPASYDSISARAESFDAIAEVFEKIVEAESPRPWLCPDYGLSCGGAHCPGEANHIFTEQQSGGGKA